MTEQVKLKITINRLRDSNQLALKIVVILYIQPKALEM